MRAALALVALTLAGCAARAPEVPVAEPAPVALPEPPPPSQAKLRLARAEAARAANTTAKATAPSEASRNMRLYLAIAEAGLISRGKLRLDRDPPAPPVTADSLTRSFFAVALRDEYLPTGKRAPAGGAPAPLRRWAEPLAIQPVFGDSLSPADRAPIRAALAAQADRMARASRHPVSLTAKGGNLIVLVLNDDERRAVGLGLAALMPGIPPRDIAAIRTMSPGNYCTAMTYSRGGGPVYVGGVIVIRAELPPRLRSACIEEELAQAMGLANDSPLARPSIFNDDEDFAVMTRHDEALLRILYDPLLSPGMTEDQAAPIVAAIAAEVAR